MIDFSNNTEINDCIELLSHLKEHGVNPDKGSRVVKLVISDITFSYKFDDKCIENIIEDRGIKNHIDRANKRDDNVSEKNSIKVLLKFEHCKFQNNFEIKDHPNFEFDLEFGQCCFTQINLSNSKIYSKLKIRACEFYFVHFENTTFNDLLDIWKSNFHQKVIFYKTDFYQTTVFAACNFYENVLFTYSLIDKLVIFRQAKFSKGLDLSLSIGQGAINCFDLDLKDYPMIVVEGEGTAQYELVYDGYVSNSGDIPVQNKRETFRILKHVLLSQNSAADSLSYKVLEYNTLRKELALREFRVQRKGEDDRTYKQEKRNYIWKKCFDRIMLWLNKYSNEYGTSYGKALRFITVVGIPLFYLSSIFSSRFEFIPCFDLSTFFFGIGYFIQFLNPAHSFDYLGELDNLSNGFFMLFHVFDFLGRLVVGYGIYQFVQAFRKYK